MRDFRTWIAAIEAQQVEVGLSLAHEFLLICELFRIPYADRTNLAEKICKEYLLLMVRMHRD